VQPKKFWQELFEDINGFHLIKREEHAVDPL
jgi:hypothetical protein